MEEKKTIEISKAKFTVFLILLLVVMAAIIFWVASNEDNTEKAGITNSSNVVSKVEVENTSKVPTKVENIVDENIAKEEETDKDNESSDDIGNYTNNLTDAQNGKVAFSKLLESNELKTEQHAGYYTYIDSFGNKYNIKEIKNVASEEGMMGANNWAALFKVTVTYADNKNQTKTMDLAIVLLPNHEIQNQGTYLNYTGTTSFVKSFTDLYAEAEENDYFVLYKGYKIALDTTVQDLSDMELNEENKKTYNTKYYNYENGRYVGESEGELVETYDGYATVDGVKRIAISEKYNAIPRAFQTIEQLPKELIDMADYTDVDINSIDLDGDGKTEYILCYKLDYAQGDIGDGQPQASSGIMLFDSNYKKIADLVSLEDGFGVGPKTEENKVFLSIDDVEYIDIDKDGIMEIIIDVPVYEGDKISIVKYNNGKLEGQTDVKATLGA